MWGAALKSAAGPVQLRYVLEHMLEADITERSRGWEYHLTPGGDWGSSCSDRRGNGFGAGDGGGNDWSRIFQHDGMGGGDTDANADGNSYGLENGDYDGKL